MNMTAMLGLCVALLGGAALVQAEDKPAMPGMPPMASPAQEHAWLEQFVGEWENVGEMSAGPNQPPIKTKGYDKTRMLGGFWIVSEGKGEMPGTPVTMHSVLTLGYDPEKKKYVGSWIDSVSPHLWRYEGTVDATGKALTLETEGPCPFRPGTAKFRDVMEFKSKDHRVLTSSMQGDDGKWQTIMTVHFHRKA